MNILKNTSLWTLGFIQGIKDFFNIWKLIKLIFYNKLKKKNCENINRESIKNLLLILELKSHQIGV